MSTLTATSPFLIARTSTVWLFSQDDKMLTDRLKSVCDSLVANNRNTSNFKTLIKLLLEKADFDKLQAQDKYVVVVTNRTVDNDDFFFLLTSTKF